MSEVSADLQVNFQSFADDTPFELVVEDTGQSGNQPVQVKLYWFSIFLVIVRSWEQSSATANTTSDTNILETMLVPGEKRIKVYCSQADSSSVKLIVDNGEKLFEYYEPRWETYHTATFGTNNYVWAQEVTYVKRVVKVNFAYPLGRRYDDPIVEALTWSGEVTKRLRYFYDNPRVEIMQKTVFRDRKGNILPDPVYNPQRGTFSTNGEAIGALVVRYSPGYSLYRVLYDTGKDVASPDLWADMKHAWLFGDIKKAEVPPVRLIALSNKAAVTASFAREFFPEGYPKLEFAKDDGDGNGEESKVLIETLGTRKIITKRIDFTDTDPDPFAEMETWSSCELQDETGKLWKLNFLNSNSPRS